MANIYEIAKAAAVSPKTVARILNGDSQSSVHRAKVLSCAEALGYVRNQQAANLRTGRTQLIGVLVPYIDNPFYTKFLQEMHDAMHAKNHQGLIACSFGDAKSTLAALRLFETYNVNGVVVDVSEGAFTTEVRASLDLLRQRSCSIVIAGVQLHDISYDHLYLDNKSAITKVVKHLATRGRDKLGFLGGMPDNPNIHNRLEGFKSSVRRLGLSTRPDWIGLGDASLSAVSYRAQQLLNGRDRPNAIICTSDMIAMAAIRAAVDKGLHVPRDLAVTGFDDIDQAALLNPSLTTVRQPMHLMAEDIVALLLRHRVAPEVSVMERRYEGELVIREST